MKNKLLSLICASACILMAAACEKEENEDVLAGYVGDYTLQDIIWTNTETGKTKDLLKEFAGRGGFVEDWISGEIVIHPSYPHRLLIKTAIPVDIAVMSGDDVLYRTIEYYSVTITAVWISQVSPPHFKYRMPKLLPSSGTNKKGLGDIILDDTILEEDSFEVHAEYARYNETTKSFDGGTVVYYFKR